jgi:aminopeptidase YwaD
MSRDFKKLLLIFALCIFGFGLKAQDASYARMLIDTLSSPLFHGRGYVNEGDRKAAVFIKNEFQKNGLQPLDSSFFNFFALPVNTFPKNMKVKAGKKDLTPGADFIVAPYSNSDSGVYKLVYVDKALLESEKKLRRFLKSDMRDKYLVLDAQGIEEPEHKAMLAALGQNPGTAKGIVKLNPGKLTWSVSQSRADFTSIEIQKQAFPAKAKKIFVHIDAKFIPAYRTQNVIGYVPGTTQPDSFIVFTAHYDHLGRMGETTLFPGANDNASGTAMLIDLADHYARNPSPYSVAFMAFAAEEAGIVGSKHYTEQPLFPLQNIRFLVNLDLMGAGEEGITVVNGSVFNEEFSLIKKINARNNHLAAINERGKAANSDHYYFTEKGVPSFFIYTLGGSKAYHDIYDTPEKIQLPVYEELFRLLLFFTAELTGGYEKR